VLDQVLPDPSRRERILKNLGFLGSGPQSNYATLCALLDSHADLPSASMLMHHMIRELDSALREVLREVPAREMKNRPKGVSGHSVEIVAIAAALGLGQEVVEGWSILPDRQHEWVHRHDLDRPAPVDQEVLERIATLEWVFDKVLEAFADRYGMMHERLRALAALAHPKPSDAERLRKEFPQDSVTYTEFFRLAGPQWLDPLDEDGAFAEPPGVRDEGGSFPFWPAMAFLLRTARIVRPGDSTDPATPASNLAVRQKIARIAAAIPATDNMRVGANLAALARSLGPDLAAGLVPRLQVALDAAFVMALDEYAGLAAELAEAGDHAGARVLIDAVLRLEDRGEDPTPVPVMGDWEFAEVLRVHTPALTRAMGTGALEMFAQILAVAPGTDAALTRVWLPSVATAATDSLPDPRACLAAAVRDSADLLIGNGTAVEEVLALLPLHPVGVLGRIRLYLLAREAVAAAAPDAAREAMTDLVLLHARAVETEYLALLHARAGLLHPQQRTALLAAIAAGPDLALWRSTTLETQHAQLSAEAAGLLQAQWRLNRYAAAESVLDESGRAALRELGNAHGTAPFLQPRTPRMIEAFRGPATNAGLGNAATAHELANALTAAAAAVQPERRTAFNPVFTLGAELRAAVGANGAAYSSDATALGGLEPYLMACAIAGFADAVRTGGALDWPGLTALLTAAADAAGTPRDEAVALVRAAAGRNALAPDAAGAAWAILASALAGTEAADCEQDAVSRAEAVRAAAEYARWARRAGVDDPAAAAALAGIDASIEPAEVAEAYGSELWTLLDLGDPAAASLLDALQPGTAAFSGYLLYFHLEAERRVLPAYRRALAPGLTLAPADHERIGTHLLNLYLRGEIGLEAGGLAESWWRHPATSPRTVRDLANYLALLRPAPGLVGEAFNAYMDWRLDALAPPPGTVLDGDARLELMILAPTCLETGQAGPAVDRLARIFSATGELPADQHTWQRLADAVNADPRAVLTLVREWTTVLTDRSPIPGRRDAQVTAIWQAGLGSANTELVELATSAINRAARAGFPHYLDLLP